LLTGSEVTSWSRRKKGDWKRMGVKKVGEKYRCNVCGNEVTVTRVGGGTLVCCGQDMENPVDGQWTRLLTREEAKRAVMLRRISVLFCL
jgi:desulfoferrodoxin-like iron-binding protein